MRDHNDIRFKPKKVDKASDKVFMLIQVRALYAIDSAADRVSNAVTFALSDTRSLNCL